MLDTSAAMALQAAGLGFAFGRFVMHRRQRQLLDNGEPVEIGSRAFEVLLALVEADGALVTKDAMLGRVWPDVIVEENNLQVQISSLRRALGSDRDWIVTIPGRGYRFTGPVAALPDEAAARRPHPGGCDGPARLSVLVLPFAGRGGDPAQDWFAAAITDSLTTDIARSLSGSTVIAQTTADTYKGRPANAREIGQEQGVHYVLEGSVLLADDQVRVNAQLIEAKTGAHLWAERFDKPRRNVLGVQDEIVGRLSRSVGLHMIDAEAKRVERTEHERPGHSAAADFVLRGRAAANQRMMTRVGIEAACILYASALKIDPDNVDALAGIACLRVYQVVHGYLNAGQTVRDEDAARETNLAEAKEKLNRALAAAPDHLAALKGRAVLLRTRGTFADAISAAETVLTHNPGEPMAHREIGLSLLYLGRAEEAVDWFHRAETLAPGDPVRWTWLQGLGRALIQLGRDAEAVDVLRLAVGNNSTFAFSHALLAAALALMGDDAHAKTAMAEFRRAEPDTSVEMLARRCAVPYEATDLLYRSRNERVLGGLRRASLT